MMASPTAGRALWLAALFYLALQNSQLVLPMLTAAMLGFEALTRERRGESAICVAFALLVLRRRHFVTAVGAELLAVALSLLGTAWVHGREKSARRHVAWPLSVLGKSTTEVLEHHADGGDPFDGNESYQAWIVRAEPWLNETVVSWLNPALGSPRIGRRHGV